MRRLILVITALLIMIGAAFGEGDVQQENKDLKKRYLYQWTDKKGVPHITDGLGKVPEEYRSEATKIESPKKEETTGQEQGGTPYRPDPAAEEAEAGAKAAWQQRMRDWKSRLQNGQKQYQDLDRQRKELFLPWGSSALAPIGIRQQAERLEQQMKDVQAEIDTARTMIESVIPEEARKAGVPPGWLRE